MAEKKTQSRLKIDIPEIHVGADVCKNPDASSKLEWLETNGIGGYASSTVIGMNTRRYHGLLVAAVNPPAERMVAVSKLEETVTTPEGIFALASNKYPSVIFPEGYDNLESFHLDPFPRWIFNAGSRFLEKTFLLIHGRNAAAVRYRWLNKKGAPIDEWPAGAVLSARLFIAYRDYHHLIRSSRPMDSSVREENGAIVMRPAEGLPELFMRCEGFAFRHDPSWYYNFEYDVERERGLDFQEDLLSPGLFVGGGGACTVFFSVGEPISRPVRKGGEVTLDEMFDVACGEEMARRVMLLKRAGAPKDENTKRLVLASDAFIVRRGETGSSVLAGYPWFTDWGRDAMISLPGLALSTGRTDAARSILQTFSNHVHEGLIPNRFPDSGEPPAYNTVDAPLWYIIAADSYVRETRDYSFLKDVLWSALKNITGSYMNGTLNDIRMDTDGLITAGSPATQLTWMDAKVGDWVVTPRHGKAVEINALWYNALRIMERLALRAGEKADVYRDTARKVNREFTKVFWCQETNSLYDVVNENGADPSIRPNQIFALSLPRPLLTADKRKSVFSVVEKELLTPCGLRTLAPGNPRYHGVYSGGVIERDGAYHQGTVWPWLLGHYVFAMFAVKGKNRNTVAAAKKIISGLESHLTESGCLGQVSEIFDGDEPHNPRGCFAQAWSVAELLRIKRELE